jgi:sterol O-acyltransferase
LGKKNRVACQFAIFLISATFHEYVITLAFGFFYPVLFVMFGAIGFGCLFLKSDKNTNLWNFITVNIFFNFFIIITTIIYFIKWIGLQIGLGGLMCLYSIEWFARKNCTQSIESPFWDYVLPRSFTCGNGLNLPINSVKYDL